MTNEKILNALNTILKSFPEEDVILAEKVVENRGFAEIMKVSIITQEMMLAGLMNDIKANIRAEVAKQEGKTKPVAAAKRILKKSDIASLLYPYNDGEYQFITNRYYGVRLRDFLPIAERPEEIKDEFPMGVRELYARDVKEFETIPKPALKELKIFIKENRAAMGKDKTPVKWDFGDKNYALDAEYLANILEILPDSNMFWDKKRKIMYFVEGENRGILCAMANLSE